MLEDGGPLLDGVRVPHLEEPGVLSVEVGDDARDMGAGGLKLTALLGIIDDRLDIGQEVEEHGLLACIWSHILLSVQWTGVVLCQDCEVGHGHGGELGLKQHSWDLVVICLRGHGLVLVVH